MEIDLLEFAQKLAEGGRAKVVEDRQRLEKLQARPSIVQRTVGLASGTGPIVLR
jgi:hypothetical protein